MKHIALCLVLLAWLFATAIMFLLVIPGAALDACNAVDRWFNYPKKLIEKF